MDNLCAPDLITNIAARARWQTVCVQIQRKYCKRALLISYIKLQIRSWRCYESSGIKLCTLIQRWQQFGRAFFLQLHGSLRRVMGKEHSMQLARRHVHICPRMSPKYRGLTEKNKSSSARLWWPQNLQIKCFILNASKADKWVTAYAKSTVLRYSFPKRVLPVWAPDVCLNSWTSLQLYW